jgi:hypothetical protein
MTAPTNTNTTLDAKGIREDLSNLIFRVAAEQTPFISNIGRAKASNIYHEWQTEALANPSATNAALEGSAVGTLGAPNLTSRVGNRCQILTKSGGVSGTLEAVDKAGRKSELARQKMLKGKEVMRDLEMRAIGNYASVAESGGTTRKLGGALAWLETNVDRGAGGSDGGFDGTSTVDAAGNGTQRTFTETQLKAVMALAFAEGATPSQAYMSGAHKQQASAFTGIADIRVDANGKKPAVIMGAADFYVSDFGTVAMIPHPYGLTRDVLIADPDMFALATLRPWFTQKLATTGDNEQFQMIGEYTLECKNEKAHAAIADLT